MGFVICTLHQILLGWNIKREMHVLVIPWHSRKMTRLKCIGCKDVDCIHLAQDRGPLWALVNTEINFLFL
jgi:hypothetical protein